MTLVSHPWKNGGDNSQYPLVEVVRSNDDSVEQIYVAILADGDVDADGSPRATAIDPGCGQLETSLRRSNGWRGPNENVNSENIPFFVLPLNWESVTGVKCELGDLGLLTYKDKSVFAIYADQGPNELIGEASICAVEALGFNPWNLDGTKIVRGIPHGVKYQVFPGISDLQRTTDFESIQAFGKEVYGKESNPAKRFPSESGGKVNILSSCQIPGTLLNEYLKRIDKKAYADADMGGSYEKWGKTYGVNYLYAFAQMLHETNDLKFGGDVLPEQNNFAGIGATGAGARGESFKTIDLGVGAQIQHLAVYAGKQVPKGELIALRTLGVYDIILGRSPTFEGLAGTWAADTSYWPKVRSKAEKVSQFISITPNPSREATEFEFNRYDNGDPSCLAYAGETPIEEYKERDVEKLISFLKKHPKARSYTVADTTKPIPPVDANPEQESDLPPFAGELKRGSKGEGVMILQKALNEHFDAQLTIDGDFGPATEEAVKKVEAILGNSLNGIVDQDLWKALGVLKGLKQDITPAPVAGAGWIPFARTPSNDAAIAKLNKECGGAYPTHFTYQGGWPTGAIVHFTAGSDDDGYGTLRYLSGVDAGGEHNYPCLLLNRGGTVLQAFPASKGGAHSGTSHHNYCVGIELCAAGRCTNLGNGTFKTWFKKILPQSEIRYAARNAAEHVYEGWYQKYTAAQEETLVKLLLWYKWADPTGRFDFDKVIGHDHACDVGGRPGDKNDPGGALSMTMSQLRVLLKQRFADLMKKSPEEQKAYFNS